ncbi:MAG TPA: hypothetical protein IAB42_04900 [Candidatus Coproplasma avistercoris]|nr:hypothetical protein [Candidatus Coproplasma avistercoris]
MKKQIIAAILLSLCIACLSLSAAGCSDNSAELEAQIAELTERNEQLEEENEKLQGSNGDIQGRLEELRQQFEELSASNALTEEQLAELQKKFNVLYDIDRLSPTFSTIYLHVYIKPEYNDKTYTAEDFSPIEISDVFHSESDPVEYLIVLTQWDMEDFLFAVIKLLNFDFVDYLRLVTGPTGI